MWIGRNPTLWINDSWTAHELLEKRANIVRFDSVLLDLADLFFRSTRLGRE